MKFTSAILIATAVLAGCGKNKPKTVKLTKLGLELDVAGDIDHETGPAYVINAGGSVVRVQPATRPFTLDEAKVDQSYYHPTRLLAETLPDGYAIRFSRDKTGHGVFAQRTIGGKLYECTSNDNDEEDEAKAALAACKSLRPSKS